jgi:hypothetical protein
LFGFIYDPEDGRETNSETSLDFHRDTRDFIPEDKNFFLLPLLLLLLLLYISVYS